MGRRGLGSQRGRHSHRICLQRKRPQHSPRRECWDEGEHSIGDIGDRSRFRPAAISRSDYRAALAQTRQHFCFQRRQRAIAVGRLCLVLRCAESDALD